MKFLYTYHNKDNKTQEGVVCAASRDAAYAVLKKQGIKPIHVDVAPGLINHLLLIGKRGLAIIILVAFVVFAVVYAMSVRLEVNRELTEEPRQQLYGDPAVLNEADRVGWANVFESQFDRLLAAYAIPGRRSVESAEKLPEVDLRPLVILPTDLAEHAKMKRIINGMKRELRNYLAAGGSAEGYFRRLVIRQNAECGVYDQVSRELSRESDGNVWAQKNAQLRAMGLPMVERQISDLSDLSDIFPKPY